jgi:hypothetical protein
VSSQDLADLQEFESRKVVTSKGNDDPMGFGNGAPSSQASKGQPQEIHSGNNEIHTIGGATVEEKTANSSDTSLNMSTLENNELYTKNKTLNYRKNAILKVFLHITLCVIIKGLNP